MHGRGKREAAFMIMGLVLVASLFMLNLLVGSVHIPMSSVAGIISGSEEENPIWRYIILESRLPQAITAMLCGASLSVCGLMLQTAFSNPLAGPSIFGINSGASLGVAIVILFFGGNLTSEILTMGGFMAIIAGAFIGASLVILLLIFFSRLISSSVALLIVGIMLGYLSSSAISILNYFATDQSIASYVMWGMGTFGNVSMHHMPAFAVSVSVCLFLSLLLIKPLNALLLGENYASNLGFNIKAVQRRLLLLTGIQTAVVTAYCGPIAFIGLAVPHITRMLLRNDNHLQLMPCSMIIGACVALFCNVVCTLPSEGTLIPLNAVTPLIGAPIIIYVIIKQKHYA